MFICRHGSSVVAAILNCWSSFDIWWGEQCALDLKQSAFLLVKKMMILDAKVCEKFFFFCFSKIVQFDWFPEAIQIIFRMDQSCLFIS